MDWKNINFQHLNYFLVAAKHQNYTLASEELFINHSTLSKAINGLEAQLKVKLFEKNGRSLKLTKYGKILNGYVQSAMTDIQAGFDEIERITDSDHGQINIASIFTACADYLPSQLANFRHEFPDFHINLKQTTTQDIIDSVLDGQVDIGFCGEFNYAAYANEISREFIYNDEIVLVVPSSHPLAKRKSVSFEDIKNETFIGYGNSAGMNYSIRTALDRITGPDFKLKTLYSMNEDAGVIGMVRSKLGIAFVSSHANLDFHDIRVIELSDLYISYNVYMIWQSSEFLPNSLKSFKNFILKQNHP